MMAVFNNLVLFDQHVPQNSFETIRAGAGRELVVERGPEPQLTFTLRQGVKWHDGKPFTARDVKCTWDLLTGKAEQKAARQPAQILVPQPRGGDHRRATTRSPST